MNSAEARFFIAEDCQGRAASTVAAGCVCCSEPHCASASEGLGLEKCKIPHKHKDPNFCHVWYTVYRI